MTNKVKFEVIGDSSSHIKVELHDSISSPVDSVVSEGNVRSVSAHEVDIPVVCNIADNNLNGRKLVNMSEVLPSLDKVVLDEIVTPVLERQDQNMTNFVSRSHSCVANGERQVLLFNSSQSEREFIQGMLMLHELVKESGVPNCDGVKIPVFSGIKCDYVESELKSYHNFQIVELMRYGAPIGHAAGMVDSNELAFRIHSGARSFSDDID